jgi:DNA invertase Pin-like site-specific DNA recombinase
MKIAIYARVSTDKQETDNQLLELRKFADAQGWSIVREYVDAGESGTKADRAELNRMFADASKRKFDLLLFWALDRLSREGVLQTLNYLNRLEHYGIAYRSYTEPFFDSCGPFKDVALAIFATLAKQEAIKRSERTKAGLARIRATGRVLGRPKATVTISDVLSLRSAGMSNRAIARKLGVSEGTIRNLCVKNVLENVSANSLILQSSEAPAVSA